ncbi:MAG: DUF3413 domain-containing protein [Gammaproteobacteria bacterium]|nr:MAG: DUF3413 domain-containing protein [Gammaproteobacteria bacterium]
MKAAESRRALLRWSGWFIAANIGLYCLLGLRYLLVYRFPADLAGYVYVPLALIGQMSLLAALPLGLLLLPLALLWPRRGLLQAAGALLAALGLSLLLLDTQVFAQNRFHLSLLTAALFEWSTWLFTALMFCIFVVFEWLLAGSLWRALARRPGARRGYWLTAGLACAWLAATGLHIWGDAVAHTPVTQFTRYLPLYYPVGAKRDLARLGWVDPDEVQRRRLAEQRGDPGEGQLRYPLRPLDCRPPQPPLNLVMILIDALRPDAIHSALTPRIAAFRDRNISFAQHYSGGNSSRMGFFSMFYSLPSTYWRAFYNLARPPVLIDQLQAAGYELLVYSAVGFGSPTLLDQTVFASLADLPGEGSSSNRDVTRQWLQRLRASPPARPFFAFLYYDPPIATVAGDGSESLPMDDRFRANPKAWETWRRYRLAIRRIDAEVGRVLDGLAARGLLDSTVVIIASDHGYEFDDNGLGYIGHASNFSRAQLQSTLLLHWPGRAAQRIEHRTSHYDLPPTLLRQLLGCRNDPADYGVGQDLFSGKEWNWIIAGSYSAHAIVQPDKIVVSYPGGFVEVLDAHYRPLGRSALDPALLRESLAAMSRFYR